jgi:hypothetical protein
MISTLYAPIARRAPTGYVTDAPVPAKATLVTNTAADTEKLVV